MKESKLLKGNASIFNLKKFALKSDQLKKIKGGTDVVTEDLADI